MVNLERDTFFSPKRWSITVFSRQQYTKDRDRHTRPVSFISVFCADEACSADRKDVKALERQETLMWVLSCCEHDKYKQTSLTSRDKYVLIVIQLFEPPCLR